MSALNPPSDKSPPYPDAAALAARVVHVVHGLAEERLDFLAVEEPLAIVVTHGPPHDRRRATISVTMRTPGDDRELAAGLLLAERVVRHREQVLAIDTSQTGSVRLELHPEVEVDLRRLERLSYTSSACGLCGKTSIEAVEESVSGLRPGGGRASFTLISALPERLRGAQTGFAQTGGHHAAALFDYGGELLSVREDVGRHNAVDKLIGAELLAGRLPLDNRILIVSGRAGFELIQKAAAAGIAIFAAVGAPSSLAVGLATRLGMTLIGFLRGERFNIYCGAERIVT